MKLDDGIGTIVLNSKSKKAMSKELISFFDYLNKQNVSEDDPLIKAIDAKVKKFNDEKWRSVVRTLDDKIREEKCCSFEEGEKIGRELGREEERKANIRNTIEILRELNLPDEEIGQKISKKFDLSLKETKGYMELF